MVHANGDTNLKKSRDINKLRSLAVDLRGMNDTLEVGLEACHKNAKAADKRIDHTSLQAARYKRKMNEWQTKFHATKDELARKQKSLAADQRDAKSTEAGLKEQLAACQVDANRMMEEYKQTIVSLTPLSIEKKWKKNVSKKGMCDNFVPFFSTMTFNAHQFFLVVHLSIRRTNELAT